MDQPRARPLKAFVNRDVPPLDVADDTYDLVYAFSVFTHLTDSWSAWLLELHRVLKPGGLFVVTILSKGMSDAIAHEPWDPARVGMNVLRPEQSWSDGGPSVLLSSGGSGSTGAGSSTSGWSTAASCRAATGWSSPLAKDLGGRTPDAAALEAVGEDAERELAALRHNVRQAGRDLQVLQDRYEASLSWRVTQPLRAAGRAVRDRRRSA